ncbi:MAG: amino acid adenylation domain-containing protein [Gammaproteobacteria bacterium]|nr:amino acid adenylation domain-containing protein [Gammaproteobacteria bacterium]
MQNFTEADHGMFTAPLSSAQRRLWFLDRLHPNSDVYNIPLSYRLSGRLDTTALKQSIAVVVGRHDSMRTSFVERNGEPFQVIARSTDVDLPVADLSDLSSAEQKLKVRELIEAERHAPFNLAHGPLFRFKLLYLGRNEHIFAVNLHHIITDGWSMDIMYREIGVVYRALQDGESPQLPDVATQYRDYVTWQASRFHDPKTQADLQYWREKLEGISALDLPTDRPRPRVKSYRGRADEFPLPEPVFAGMERLCRDRQATLFIVWLAALLVFLHRYCGHTDVTVGTPIAGRNHWEFETTIGLFIDTLVLRGDLSGNPSFSELLERVRTLAIEAYDHQSVPFETLVEVINPERVMNRSPFFDVLLNVRSSESKFDLPGLNVTRLRLGHGGAKFDLTFSVKPEESSIVIEYSTDLFDVDTIKRMASHFATLLENIVADANCPIGELALLDDKERNTMLIDWNATEYHSEQGPGVHQWFQTCAAEFPDSPCVVFDGIDLTYSELDERSSQLARFLLARGVGAAHRIGIYMDRCLELPVAVMGVLKAGAAYVPLDTRMPRKRLEHILSETEALAVLTQGRLADQIPDLGVEIIAVDRDWEEVGRLPGSDPGVRIEPGSLMYVMYTSGSTGRPKGVEVEHCQVLNYIDGIIQRLELGPHWSYAMAQPLAVDSSVTVFFPSLCTGGVLHLLTEDAALDSTAMEAYLSENQIDVLKIAPTHLAALQFNGRFKVMPRRCLVVGGEPCPADWVYALADSYPEVAIHNHYGPTETTVGVLTHRVPAGQERKNPVPLGRPLANTQVFVLDRYSNPVPIGIEGEMWVQGRGVARGYLGRPELTEAMFIENPLVEGHGGRVYRTGDRVRYRPDGNIEFRGRSDDQIKIRGFRVELREIERVLVEHEAVQDAVVAQNDQDTELVALVVATDTGLDHTELKNHAARYLPEYMVPGKVAFVDELPRTMQGKVDMRALTVATQGIASTSPLPSTLPETDTEKRLTTIWSSQLKIKDVGVTDSFFSLGGHSLLAVKVIAYIAQEWGVRIPVRALFENPTITTLAKKIDELVAEGPATETPTIKRLPRALQKKVNT